MSAPVITGVQVIYPNGQTSLAPGQTAQVVVSATDADNYTLDGVVTVTDSGGNSSTAPFHVVVADGLTYAATSSQQGASVVQDPAQPNRFYVTAPAN